MLDDLRAQEQTRQYELAEAREVNCDKSRLILARLSTTNRVRVRDIDGIERMMPEEERQERINRASSSIASPLS